MENPLISIVVPVYNCEQYISECIDSILGQTYTNIQLILVDDGSTDNSLAICENYLDRDRRVLLISQENLGVSMARNAGLDAAEGAYIGFVDSDDFIDRKMYEKLFSLIRRDCSDCAACLLYTSPSPRD